MKSALRIFIPSFAPFRVMAWLGKVLISYNADAGQLSEITFNSLLQFLSLAMPLLFVMAVLMQVLIVLQISNSTINKASLKRIIYGLSAAGILISIVISYIVWQPDLSLLSLLKSVFVLLTAQCVYWFINLSALVLTDIKYNQFAAKAQ